MVRIFKFKLPRGYSSFREKPGSNGKPKKKTPTKSVPAKRLFKARRLQGLRILEDVVNECIELLRDVKNPEIPIPQKKFF